MTERDLLIVGAGLGTCVGTLWGSVADLLKGECDLIGVDLPGHGAGGGGAPSANPFTVKDLADNVRKIARDAGPGRDVWYAGVSLAGAVAYELALDPSGINLGQINSGQIKGVAAIAAASRFGEPTAWLERATLVRKAGTPAMVAGSSQRWFAPGFIDRDRDLGNDTVSRMLHDLSDTDDESYALCCEALAAYDVREALSEIHIPFLLAAGAQDVVITPDRAAEDAAQITQVSVHVFEGCGHQPPVEDPEAVAETLIRFMNTQGASQ